MPEEMLRGVYPHFLHENQQDDTEDVDPLAVLAQPQCQCSGSGYISSTRWFELTVQRQ